MIVRTRQPDIWGFPNGTVIRVSHGWYEHVGLLGDRSIAGERSVLSFSAESDGLVEQPFSAFSRGRMVRVDGYLGCLPSAVVLQRARTMEGCAYSWLNFNCEHFIRHAHGVSVESPQLRQWGFWGGVAGLLMLAARA